MNRQIHDESHLAFNALISMNEKREKNRAQTIQIIESEIDCSIGNINVLI